MKNAIKISFIACFACMQLLAQEGGGGIARGNS